MENVLVGAAVLVGIPLLLIAAGLLAIAWKRPAASGATIDAEWRVEVGGRLDRLETGRKLLQSEWNDVHSRLDTLIRRGVRLGVLERKNGEGAAAEEPPAPEVETRAEVLRRYRERQARS